VQGATRDDRSLELLEWVLERTNLDHEEANCSPRSFTCRKIYPYCLVVFQEDSLSIALPANDELINVPFAYTPKFQSILRSIETKNLDDIFQSNAIGSSTRNTIFNNTDSLHVAMGQCHRLADTLLIGAQDPKGSHHDPELFWLQTKAADHDSKVVYWRSKAVRRPRTHDTVFTLEKFQ